MHATIWEGVPIQLFVFLCELFHWHQPFYYICRFNVLPIQLSWEQLTLNYFFLDIRMMRSVYACQNKTIKLKCERPKVLEIAAADYGRGEDSICEKDRKSDEACKLVDTTEAVKSLCNKKRRCKMKVSSSTFGDPCAGLNPYLNILYVCGKSNVWYVRSINKLIGWSSGSSSTIRSSVSLHTSPTNISIHPTIHTSHHLLIHPFSKRVSFVFFILLHCLYSLTKSLSFFLLLSTKKAHSHFSNHTYHKVNRRYDCLHWRLNNNSKYSSWPDNYHRPTCKVSTNQWGHQNCSKFQYRLSYSCSENAIIINCWSQLYSHYRWCRYK